MNKVFFGDCRESLRQMAADGVKVQTCVTSPPYYGLRDYGHEGQLGLEDTPEQYIANMVEVFQCVRDVLADDGTLWVNIGDSYAGSWGNQGRKDARGTQREIKGPMIQPVHDGRYSSKQSNTGKIPEGSGLKPKDLIGIPWMLAFALRADGWYLRQDIIWSKPNPMPESVTDRCTKSHEYIFLLSKSSRYYCDMEAIKEPAVCGWNDSKFHTGKTAEHQMGRAQVRPSAAKGSFNGKTEAMADTGQNAFRAVVDDRNKRSVWSVATKPYTGAHFAVYPPELIEPCILAGSRPNDIVLDPFFGSGTTGQVASSLGRQYIGCEINPEYEELQKQRTRQMGLVLA
jgi:DNA modification methylase